MRIVDAPLQIKPEFDIRDWTEIEIHNKQIKDVITNMESVKSAKHIEWAIGGGSISDAYMNVPFQDVDIFIAGEEDAIYKFLEDIQSVYPGRKESVCLSTETAYHVYNQHLALLKLEHNDAKVDIVQCRTLNRMHDFDITMRKFAYYKGKYYADPKALEDIENKIVTVNVPTTPYFTMHRMLVFANRYGFSLCQDSLVTLSKLQSMLPDHYQGYSSPMGDEDGEEIRKYWKTKPEVTEEIRSRAAFLLKQESPYDFHPVAKDYIYGFLYQQGVFLNISQDQYYAKANIRDGNVSLFYEQLKNYNMPDLDLYHLKSKEVEIPVVFQKEIEQTLLSLLYPFLKKHRLTFLMKGFVLENRYFSTEFQTEFDIAMREVYQTKSISPIRHNKSLSKMFLTCFLQETVPSFISKENVEETEWLRKLCILSSICLENKISVYKGHKMIRSCLSIQLEEPSVHFSITLKTDFDLVRFPFDVQELSSYVVTKDTIYREKSDTFVDFSDNMMQYILKEHCMHEKIS